MEEEEDMASFVSAKSSEESVAVGGGGGESLVAETLDDQAPQEVLQEVQGQAVPQSAQKVDTGSSSSPMHHAAHAEPASQPTQPASPPLQACNYAELAPTLPLPSFAEFEGVLEAGEFFPPFPQGTPTPTPTNPHHIPTYTAWAAGEQQQQPATTPFTPWDTATCARLLTFPSGLHAQVSSGALQAIETLFQGWLAAALATPSLSDTLTPTGPLSHTTTPHTLLPTLAALALAPPPNCQPPPPSSLPRMPLPTSPPCTLPLCSPVTLYAPWGSLGCIPWRSALSHPAPLLACTVAWQQLQQRCPRQCSSWCSSAGLPRLLGGRRGGPGQAPTHTRLPLLQLLQQGSRGAVRRRHRLLLPVPPPVPPLPLPCAYTARRPLLRCITACACAPLGRALRLPAGP